MDLPRTRTVQERKLATYELETKREAVFFTLSGLHWFPHSCFVKLVWSVARWQRERETNPTRCKRSEHLAR